MIKAIIFDNGGVITSSDEKKILHKLGIYLNVNGNDILKLRIKYSKQLCIGQINTEKFCNILKEKFKIKKDIIKYYKKIYGEATIKDIDKDIFNIIIKLKKYYKVAMLSNATDISVEQVKKIDLFSNFDVIILSCEVGMNKPYKGIYKLLLKKLNLEPKECIFIDDKIRNLDSAKVGNKNHTF